MTEKTSNTSLMMENFFSIVEKNFGLHFIPKRWQNINAILSNLAQSSGFTNINVYLAWLITHEISEPAWKVVINRLTVGETYFFRDTAVFQTLKQLIFPNIISSQQQTRHLKIWSTGCSSGEESYSLAILLYQLLPAPNDWFIEIFGTDINGELLTRAIAAKYSMHALKYTPKDILKTYFKVDGPNFTLIPAIKNMVKFKYLNLVKDVYPTNVDLIFCHNVLMYFSNNHASQVVSKFVKTLSANRWLSVAAAEMAHIQNAHLEIVDFETCMLFRKKNESFSIIDKPTAVTCNANYSTHSQIKPQNICPSASTIEAAINTNNQANDRDAERACVSYPIIEINHSECIPNYMSFKKISSFVDDSIVSLIFFVLDNMIYALETIFIKAVSIFNYMNVLPTMPIVFKGLIQVHHKIVFVIDLKSLLGIPKESMSQCRHVIILDHPNIDIGLALLTDGVKGISFIPLQNIQPNSLQPCTIEAQFVKGYIADQIVILNGPNLLKRIAEVFT